MPRRFLALGLFLGLGLGAQTLQPTVTAVSSTSLTVQWSTSQRLNSQLHYGTASPNLRSANWTLGTSHSVTITGLQPGTRYLLEAESSYYSNPDLTSAVFSATTAGTGVITPPPPTPTPQPIAGSSLAVQVSNITANGFTVSWTTQQALNTQLHYGADGATNLKQASWTLSTQHSVALTGLNAGTAYTVVAESSYYSNPDLLSPAMNVTTLVAGTPAPPTQPTPPTAGARLFPAAAANWLYSAPTGSGLNISSMVQGIKIGVNTHDGGFDYPVVYTDGSHGCTNFTDTLQYQYGDHPCVPNPANGYFPSVGGWGANDGHLVVVDTATQTYYDFWKLYVNSSGQPTSTNVGAVFSGSLNGNGTPGTTAANITGLAGDILPGELDCATCLNHALSIVVPGSMNSSEVGTQAPATKTDGSGGGVFREGAKIRFDPSIDVSTLSASTATKAILRALQLYGGVITDQTGGNGISIYSSLPSQPDLTGLSVANQHLFLYY
ncbi:MAG TPA: fibronectin type III domain-containing protein [Terriglobales bacterium]|nr:fibronectin type III domain-containing protein [Terriglobales bacterium]